MKGKNCEKCLMEPNTAISLEDEGMTPEKTNLYKGFRLNYLIVYIIVMASD